MVIWILRLHQVKCAPIFIVLIFDFHLIRHDDSGPTSVRMTASYRTGEIPFVHGAGLRGHFWLSAIRFIVVQRSNGVYDDTTVYHSVDAGYYPLEMQLIAENQREILQISFFFLQQTHKNFCLEPLICHLESVKSLKSFKSTEKTFCLDQIVPKIETGFYVYEKIVNSNGRSMMMRCIIEANALIPIGRTQLERLQKIQQNLMVHHQDDGHSDVISSVCLKQYWRHRRSSRLKRLRTEQWSDQHVYGVRLRDEKGASSLLFWWHVHRVIRAFDMKRRAKFNHNL